MGEEIVNLKGMEDCLIVTERAWRFRITQRQANSGAILGLPHGQMTRNLGGSFFALRIALKIEVECVHRGGLTGTSSVAFPEAEVQG